MIKRKIMNLNISHKKISENFFAKIQNHMEIQFFFLLDDLFMYLEHKYTNPNYITK